MRSPRLAFISVAAFAASLALGCGGDTPTGGGPGPLATLTVSPANPGVQVGGRQQLAVIARDASGTVLPTPAVTWNSANPSIATVSGTGLVTGMGPGNTSVTATASGITGTATVHVTTTPPAGGLSLDFSSYLGGTPETSVRDVATDQSGNIYVTGGTSSSTFPTTAGAFQRNFAGTHDVFIVKISPAGQILWSTLIGGPNYDRAYAIEVDNQGYVYVAGRAGAGLPGTAGTFQPSFGGGSPSNEYGPQDGFICKVKPDGSALMWCSYLGTKDDRIIRDLGLDSQGNIFVAAAVDSATFPAAWFTNSFQKTKSGGADDLVAKIANDGSHVIWASYIGGSLNESGEPSLRVDAGGSPYLLCITHSADIPTPNGFNHSTKGASDLYLAKFTPDGTGLVYGAILGGAANEFTETHELALDGQEAIVASGTLSTDFPTTPGAFQTVYGGSGGVGTGVGTNYQGDAFVTRVSADGSQILASTYIGGLKGDQAEGVAVDGSGYVYFTGATYSSNFPALGSPYQSTLHGDADVIVVKLSPDLKQVLYSTYLGGSGEDLGRTAALDPFGNLIIGGMTRSSNFPTVNGIQPFNNGSYDGLIAKFSPAP